MTHNTALRLAVKALEEQSRRLAIDANMLDLYGIRTRHSEAASQQRKRLQDAIAVLVAGQTPVNARRLAKDGDQPSTRRGRA